jgi:hypothetical protein
MVSQWIAFGVVMLVIVGLVVAFSRSGMSIKPDPERKPRSQDGEPSI